VRLARFPVSKLIRLPPESSTEISCFIGFPFEEGGQISSEL
jgi:hypothetical protein